MVKPSFDSLSCACVKGRRIGTKEINLFSYHQQVRVTSPMSNPEMNMEDVCVKARSHSRVTERKTKDGDTIKLLKEIESLCQRSKQPEVILLLGDVGAGKSSLVNTVIRALTEQHLPRAKTGRGGAHSKTVTLQRFYQCGVNENDLEEGHELKGLTHMLPTLIDFAGRAHCQEEFLEILDLILGGYIPTGTSIKYLEEYQREYGIGKLSRKFNASDPALEVTKVVLVIDTQSSSLPESLIENIQRAIQQHTADGQLKYQCDLFVVLTKMDMEKDVTDEENKLDSTVSVEKSITSREERERQLAILLTIEGALNDNLFRWTSYHDNITEQNPEIDIVALKFLKTMMQQRPTDVQSSVKPKELLLKEKIQMRVEKIWDVALTSARRNWNSLEKQTKLAVLAVFVGCFIIYLLSRSVL
ncbi:uncharacterized protein LOC128222686 isoform X1 [Mya arenaria]|uniref:uncharacterized protein LOC128222686 isoform X1 n=2 Tax=Mya arenaria TaxID=6604 RepID=UPI0022E39586|nr:uncharacterized protein LOC128222686 isoform X1 [Mya arenaria]